MISSSRRQFQRSHMMLPCSILVEVGKYSRYIAKFWGVFINKILSVTICGLLSASNHLWQLGTKLLSL